MGGAAAVNAAQLDAQHAKAGGLGAAEAWRVHWVLSGVPDGAAPGWSGLRVSGSGSWRDSSSRAHRLSQKL